MPTLREAENIRAVLDRIRQSLDPLGFAYEIIVVDDDSRDGIDTIVQEIAATDPRVRILVRTGERGLGGAVSMAGVIPTLTCWASSMLTCSIRRNCCPNCGRQPNRAATSCSPAATPPRVAWKIGILLATCSRA